MTTNMFGTEMGFWRAHDSIRSETLEVSKLIFELSSAQNELKKSSTKGRQLRRGSTVEHEESHSSNQHEQKISDDGTDQARGDKLGAPPSRAKLEESQNGGEVAGSTIKTRAGREVQSCFRQFPTPFDAVSGQRQGGQRWKGVEETLPSGVVAGLA